MWADLHQAPPPPFTNAHGQVYSRKSDIFDMLPNAYSASHRRFRAATIPRQRELSVKYLGSEDWSERRTFAPFFSSSNNAAFPTVVERVDGGASTPPRHPFRSLADGGTSLWDDVVVKPTPFGLNNSPNLNASVMSSMEVDERRPRAVDASTPQQLFTDPNYGEIPMTSSVFRED